MKIHKRIHFVIIMLIFFLATAAIFIEIDLRRLTESRERSFMSLKVVLMQMEADYPGNFDTKIRFPTFKDLLLYYTDKSENEWNRITYENTLLAPSIHFNPRSPSRIYETKNFPIGIFKSDRLEVNSHDFIVRWVQSGRVVNDVQK